MINKENYPFKLTQREINELVNEHIAPTLHIDETFINIEGEDVELELYKLTNDEMKLLRDVALKIAKLRYMGFRGLSFSWKNHFSELELLGITVGMDFAFVEES